MTETREPRKAGISILRLPCFQITIRLDRNNTGKEPGRGTITSGLKRANDLAPSYNTAINGLESLILAHACVGIDVESPAYIEGIETAVEAIANQLS